MDQSVVGLNSFADNLMLQVISPRIWLPSMQIIWGILTFCSSAVQDVQQVIYLVRFRRVFSIKSCNLDLRDQIFSRDGGSV